MLTCPVIFCGFPAVAKCSMAIHLRAAHNFDEQQLEQFNESIKDVEEASRLQAEQAFEQRKYGCLEPENFVPCAGTNKSYVLRSKLHPGYCIRFSLSGTGTNNIQMWRCTSCSATRGRPFRSHNAYSREDVWITDPDGGSHVCGWPAEKHKELEVYKEVASIVVKREAKKKSSDKSVKEALLSAVMELSTAPELSRFTEEEIAAIQQHPKLRDDYEKKRKFAEKPQTVGKKVKHSYSRTTGERSQSPQVAEKGVSAMDILLGNMNKSTDMEAESIHGQEVDHGTSDFERNRPSHDQVKQADNQSTIVLGETSMTPKISGRSSLDRLQEELVGEELKIREMKLKREAQNSKFGEEFHVMRMRTEQIKQEMYLKKMKIDVDL